MVDVCRGLTCALAIAGVMGTAIETGAQEPAGIEIRVIDQTGGVVQAATVIITSPLMAQPLVRTTDAAGVARFPNVPPAVEVRVEANGFLPVSRDVQAAPGERVEIALDIGLAESIVVGAYRPPVSTTASKLDTVPAHETPFAAQFVPVRVIEDQQARSISEALKNVSGVSTQVGFGDLMSRQRIRGFVPPSQLKNGFRQSLLSTLSDLANVERIEVLKGPASALYGPFEPGGVVNLLTKSPLDQPYRHLELSLGSFNRYRATADLSGPVDANRRWLYRLNMAAEDADSYRDFVTTRALFVAPALTWRISDATTVSAEVEYLYRDGGFDRGFGNNAMLLDVPIERNLGEPTDSTDYDGFLVRYDLQHRFANGWKLRQATMASVANLDVSFHSPGFPLLSGRDYRRVPAAESDRQRDVSLQAELSGTVSTGPLSHTVIAGIEGGFDENRFTISRGQPSLINLDAPVYGAPIGPLTPFSIGKFRTSGVSVYLQDQLALGRRWRVMAGARLDAIESQAQSELNMGGPGYDRRRDTPHVSPRAGVTYLPTPALALYASVSRAFRTDVFGVVADGLPEPSLGEQVEGGIKIQTPTGRFSTTVAVYSLTKEKVLVANPTDAFGPSLQVGEQQVNGVEVDLLGQPWSAVSVIASYAFADAEVTEDTTIPVGSRLPNVPRHSGSLWATWQLPQWLSRMVIGAGVFASGTRAAVLPNTFDLPTYARWDAMAAYRHGRYKVAVNVQNLADERYFESGGGFVPIYPQAPRSVTASIGVVF